MKKYLYTVMVLVVFMPLLVIYLSSFPLTRYSADKAATLSLLSDVKDIRVTIDDGYPKGRADVVIITYGVTKEVTEDIFFGRLDGKWKVQNASAGWGNETELEKARSGYIP